MVSGPTAWNAPDFFVGKSTPLSAYEPYPMMTGSVYSSLTPSSAGAVHWVQPGPVVVQNLVMQNSMNVSAPGATSQASTGSEAFTYGVTAFVYSRQDYAANSSQLAPVISASFGLSASLGYSSTSQQFGMSWQTDSSGGAANFTTTSSDAGWSNFASAAKVIVMPLATTLGAGEYWICFQHSSTAATSNSAVTLLSMSQLQMQAQQAAATAGLLGASVTANSAYGACMDFGQVGATPVFNTTMALSSYLAGGNRGLWFALRNY